MKSRMTKKIRSYPHWQGSPFQESDDRMDHRVKEQVSEETQAREPLAVQTLAELTEIRYLLVMLVEATKGEKK